MNKKEENRIFKEAVIGYGFIEVIQRPDGLYCTGCHTTHKLPTKMYTMNKEVLCKYQVVQLYNPELQ